MTARAPVVRVCPDFMQLPKPTNEDAFETLCLDAWRYRLNTIAVQKNGRRGQAQNGVDLVGRDLTGRLIAIQCKLLIQRPSITCAELAAEAVKAAAFRPALSEFWLAYSGARDQALQERARQLTDDNARRGLFQVGVYSWSELEEDVQRHPIILELNFPQFAGHSRVTFGRGMDGVLSVSIDLSDQADADVLRAFDELAVCGALSTDYRMPLRTLGAELALNAHQHGKAHFLRVRISPTAVTLATDGLPFDPLISRGREGAGLRTLREVTRPEDRLLTAAYSYKDGLNTLHSSLRGLDHLRRRSGMRICCEECRSCKDGCAGLSGDDTATGTLS